MAELQSENLKYAVKTGASIAEGMLFVIDTKQEMVFISLWDIVR